MTIPENPSVVGRRTLLAQAIGACLAFLSTLLGIPAAVAAVGPSLRRTEAAWFELGPVESFPDGAPTPARFPVPREDGWLRMSELKMVWVVRETDGGLTVFNGRCTHLGCAYNWQAEQNRFFSPCHNGVFAKDGRVLGGPPPRPLDPLPTRFEAGKLFVQYFDFRLGTADRVPL